MKTIQPLAKIRLSIVLILLLNSGLLIAQAPIIHWENNFGGSESDIPRSLVQTPDGGYVIAGRTYSTDGDVTNNTGYPQAAWIIKVDNNGNLLWNRALGTGGSGYNNTIVKIRNTTDGGFIATGSTSNVSNQDIRATYYKLNQTGNISWGNTFGGGVGSFELGSDILQTANGGYVMTGTISDFTANAVGCGGEGANDILVMRLSSNGTLEWVRCLGGSNHDNGLAIQQTSDGGFIVAAQTSSSDGIFSGNPSNDPNTSIGIVKLDNEGFLSWSRVLGGTGRDLVSDIKQTPDGGYIFTGFTNSTDVDVAGNPGGEYSVWVVKLNASGDLVWQNCMGGSERDTSTEIILTNDGGYLICGSTSSSDGDVSGNNGGSDIWVVKLNDTGTILWEKSYGGSLSEFGAGIIQNTEGDFVMAGYSYSSDGDVGGNNGEADFWIVKLSHDPLNVNEFEKSGFYSYPNPTSGMLNLKSLEFFTQIDVVDITGKKILSKKYTPGAVYEDSLDISMLSNGFYLLKANLNGRIVTQKIMKE